MRQKLYPIAFTVLLSSLCGVAIAGAQIMWGPLIEALEQYEKQEAVLSVFGIVEPGEYRPKRVTEIYEEHVSKERKGEMLLYKIEDPQGEPLGVAFDVNGKGRNGDVFGVMALAPDRETVRGVRFYRHKETPGYGGKISTPWFTNMFVGKEITGPDGTPGFEVSIRGKGPRKVDAITGASQTTRNIVGVINRRIREFISGGREVKPFELDLPEPVSSDIGLNIDVQDLVKPTGKARPPLMAPPGTNNVARGKPVTSGAGFTIIGEFSQITDGVKEAGFGNFVEMMGGLQWVQIDLEQPCELFAILFWHEHTEPRVYYDVIVQLADDPEFTQNVRTVFNNDRDNSAGLGKGSDMHYVDNYQGKLILVGGEVARYVRLYSNGNHKEDVNRYIEVEVFGIPVDSQGEDQ